MTFLRYKEISGKVIVSVKTGSRLGVLGQTDIQINRDTGKIESFLIPSYTWFGLKKNDATAVIRWESVKKIGNDFILIDSEEIDSHELRNE